MMWRIAVAVVAGLALMGPEASAEERERPIPQDPERQARRSRDLLAWERKTLVEVYDRIGKKDPRWDVPARQAMEAASRYFSQINEPAATPGEVYSLAKRAIDAGCDDPCVIYLYGRMGVVENYPGPEEYERREAAGALAMLSSGYPTFRRLAAFDDYALTSANRAGQDPKTRQAAFERLDQTLDLMIESRSKDEWNPDLAELSYQAALRVLLGYQVLGLGDLAALERVDAKLAKSADLKSLRLLLKGMTLLESGWRARGNGTADTVTEEGARKFEERLTEARKALDDAWALDPTHSTIANTMLIVEKGIGGDRDMMETWFERAMKADSNNLEACKTKMDWLDPKWYGTPEDLLAFGRACRATNNWRSKIPLLLPDAHHRIAQHLAPAEQETYFESSKVWNEVKEVYETYFSQATPDRSDRSFFAVYCVLAGHYPEAKAQFDLIGEELDAIGNYSLEALKEMRAYATREANASRAIASIPPGPKGFRKLALEWDDPSGETGTLTAIEGCLATSIGVDVLQSSHEVFLLKDGKRAVRVFQNAGRYTHLEPSCFDGRYIWVPVRSQNAPPFLLVIDPTTEKTWNVTIEDGLPVKREEDLPVDTVQFVEVAAIEPGKVCVAGSHVDSWIANVSFDPARGGSVQPFHEAVEPPVDTDRNHWKRTTIQFRPVFMATLTGPAAGDAAEGPKRLILVGRSGSVGINVHPLVVDPDARSVSVLQRVLRFASDGSIFPGMFSVYEGRFYWVEAFPAPQQRGMPLAEPQRTLMRIGLDELDGTPLARRLGQVNRLAVHHDRIDLIGDRWWEAGLRGEEVKALELKVPWLSNHELSEHFKARRLGGKEPESAPLWVESLFSSRHLGTLVHCSTGRNPGITLQVDLDEARKPAGPDPK